MWQVLLIHVLISACSAAGQITRMTDYSEFDPDELAVEMTEEAVNTISRIFGKDFSENIDDSDMKSAQEKVEMLLTELQSFQQSNPDEEEAIEFLLEKYNEGAAQFLGLDKSELDSVDGLEIVFDEIDSKLEKFRTEGETFGYPQYFDCVESIAKEFINKEDYQEHLDTIREGWDDIGKKKVQRMFARYDSDLLFIFENTDVEDRSVVEEYLEMYEDYCEQFKTLSPFVVYSVNIINTSNGELYNRLDDNLYNLVNMCASRERIEVFAEIIDNDIRNAIAHDDYFIDPIDKEVELNVGGEDQVFSHQEVRDLAVEARCAAQSLFVFPVLIQHRSNVQKLHTLDNQLNDQNWPANYNEGE